MDNNSDFNSICADNLNVGFFRYELTPKPGFITVNKALVQMLGYVSKRHFLKERFEDLFSDPEDFKNITINKSIKALEISFKKKDGKAIWVALTVACVFKDNIKCLEGIIQNISTQKQNHERIAREKDFLQGLFDNIPDAVYFKDRKNRIVKVNEFYLKGTELTEKSVIGKTDFDFFPAEQAAEMFQDDNSVIETGVPIIGKVEKTLLPNGTWNQVITTKIPVYDKSGKTIGTMGTTRDMTTYASFERQRLDMVITTLEILGKALEMRDPYTFSHTRNVAHIAEEIGKALGWSEDRLLGLKLAAELHDLGKISIPLDILNKPGKLSTIEYSLIQEHVKNCYNLIKDIQFPLPLAEIVLQHHERLDGSGYPRKLKGNQILAEARILAVSDVLEAMTHHRPYRAALGIVKASEELKNGKGLKYDLDIVDVLIDLIENSNKDEFWLGT